MKKLVALAFVSAAFATMASAAPCTGAGVSGTDGFILFSSGTTASGSTTITCSAAAPLNNYITSVTVITFSDLTNGASTPSFTITTTPLSFSSTGDASGSGLTPGAPVVTGAAQVLSSGGFSGNTLTSLISVDVSFTASSAKTAGFTGTANGTSIDAGGIAGTGANAGQFSGIFFTYAAIPQTGVPEPATLSLVGGALLGLGLISRKRK